MNTGVFQDDAILSVPGDEPAVASPCSDPDFDEFISRHTPTIKRIIKKQIRNEDDCKDLVGQVIGTIWRSWSAVKNAQSCEGYVVRVTANTVINFIMRDKKKLKNQVPLSDWDEHNYQQSPKAGAFENSELRDLGDKILAKMRVACTPDERRVMRLILTDHDIKFVADALEMKEHTVRSHWLRGRANLLAHLRLHDHDLLGGENHVISITERFAEDPDVRLTTEEIKELRAPTGRVTILKRAMIKIAPKLGIHCILMLLARGIR